MKDKIQALSESVFFEVCNIYKYLHTHPELSFQEINTSAYIQTELTKLEIPFRNNIGTTGILGVLKGKNPSKKIIALRADMDALPVNEETDLSYKSIVPNCMHACGHDSHVASLLGVAKILSQLKNEFEGTVLFIFQPGEERNPGGARLMLQDDVFRDYTPALIIAQHASVDFPLGTVAFRAGQIMASADEIELTINGTGGHGALPHLVNDTVLCASQILVSLQQIRARLSHPLTPMVLTFGKFIANGSTNVIPHTVSLSGTLRTFDEDWRKKCKEHVLRIATATAVSYGCTCEMESPEGYPSVYNDEEVTANAIAYATELVGEEYVKELDVRMTSEDFGFFCQEYPCTFYRFGVKGNSNKQSGNLHTSTFQIDLDAFKTSVPVLAWIAWKSLL